MNGDSLWSTQFQRTDFEKYSLQIHTLTLIAIHSPERLDNIFLKAKFDELVKSLILRAPQAILGFMIRLAKLQELGLTPSNSL